MCWHWLILIAQLYVALYPVGSDAPNIRSFFENYLAACVLLIFYVSHKICAKNWKCFIRIRDIDINSDRVIFDEEVLISEKQDLEENLKK